MALRILVINAGSSSLKWSVIEGSSEKPSAGGTEPLRSDAPLQLSSAVAAAGKLDAIAHRVVHGGARFRKAVQIDDEVRGAIAQLAEIDPLHAALAIAGIDAAHRAFPAVPHFACFDTAFHATLPEAAFTYALPRAWSELLGLRRFGFHGLSVAHAVRRAPELTGKPLANMIVAHLGSGCSITAVSGGQSVDTTMGFTPLEGVVMGTRSGSIDPGVLAHLLRTLKLPVDALDRGLQHESGLLGLSELSSDLREVEAAAEAGEPRAELAFKVFVHSVRRGIGEMAAALEGLDALVFTGGIGEHSARVRREVLGNLGWMGIALDLQSNASAHPDADLSAPSSRARVLLIEAREDLTMARQVTAALGQ